MKKLLLIIAFAIFSVSSYAQIGDKQALVKAGYQTKSKRFGIGAEGRYFLTENIRLAPDVIFFFPKNHTTGLDINVNLHYVFPLQDGLSIYPLAGVNMANNRFSYNGFSNSATDFGFNIGGGLDYNLSETNFVNAQFQYTFSDRDCALFTIGYGFKF